jgi:hypothetical protein
MARKKHAARPPFDEGRLARGASSADVGGRGDAVRSLCPCHAGWEVFEDHVPFVFKALRDGDRGVRAHALHVFEDAARMKLSEEAEYFLEEVEEKLRRRRASRFRPAEVEPEEKRALEMRRRWKRR